MDSNVEPNITKKQRSNRSRHRYSAYLRSDDLSPPIPVPRSTLYRLKLKLDDEKKTVDR